MTTEVDEIELTNVAEYFRYLDALRDSGAVNMFGASPYLQKAFSPALSKADAKKYTLAWMEYFTEGHPEDRAKLYLTGAPVA